jgi:hypothetical protein
MDPNNTTNPLPAENNTVNDATLALDAAIREAQAFNQDVNEVLSRITSAIHKAQLEAVEAIQNKK